MHERVPDPETAPIVKKIFEIYLETSSSTKVAKYLYANKIKKPCYYNAIKYGYNKDKVLVHEEEYFYKWNTDVIRDILANYEYTGAYITAKSKSKNFKECFFIYDCFISSFKDKLIFIIFISFFSFKVL